MALVKESNQYKYKMSKAEILLPDKDPIEIAGASITNLGIEKDFDNDHFPILYMSVKLNPEVYYSIIENKTTVKFRLRFEKYIYDKVKDAQTTKLVFSDVFSIFINDNMPFMDKELYKKAKETEGTETPMSSMIKSYEFYLFKERDLIGSKKVFNTIMSNETISDISIFLLSSAGITDILMSPLDNSTKYSEVILPPVSVINSINYLEKQYGMYYHGLLLFFDFERAYFINKRAECTAWKTGEFKDVIVQSFKTSNPDSLTPGCYRDEENKCYILHVIKDNIDIKTASVVDDQLSGNDMVVVDSADGNVTNVNPSVQQRGDGTTKILVDNYNNPYTKRSLEYRKIENDNVIVVTLTNVDMEALTPNKKYKFIFEETDIQKKNGGEYRLTSTIYDFTKQASSDYLIRCIATFKRIK